MVKNTLPSKMIVFFTVRIQFSKHLVLFRFMLQTTTYKSNVVLLSITSFSYDFISLEASANPLQCFPPLHCNACTGTEGFYICWLQLGLMCTHRQGWSFWGGFLGGFQAGCAAQTLGSRELWDCSWLKDKLMGPSIQLRP